MKKRKDTELSGKFAKGLKDVLSKRRKNPEVAAQLLEVEIGTVYKYLAGDMIPGGKVIWLACTRLGMVLDADGFKTGRPPKKSDSELIDNPQSAFAFINELVEGDSIRAQVRKRKDNQYVQVNLRIKVAG
jgi:hypothetical protein